MARSRYSTRRIFTNTDAGYRKKFFGNRGIKKMLQYGTGRVGYPTNEEMNQLDIQTKVWTATSKLHQIAYDAYGSSEYWWVIGWFNKKPTEAHFSIGDIYYIPRPIEKALAFYGD